MITFRTLLENSIDTSERHTSPLDDWFYRVIDVPISDLSIEDICRAIRQKLFLEIILPNACNILKDEPLAGEYYDGELIASIASLSGMDISQNIGSINEIKRILTSLDLTELSKDLQQDILKIMSY
ncbi:contact-dependent growth inhibition system immunity protein [Providencia sp. PROV259]|uniref:contact-dependent growth inhibition system immunity protein n=1 Tax=Providencia sp. PROV259 TaxID=2949947 RepID=UPI00234BB58F|nr:contact-dependent growth inhibition system immunity protein [Providencia sp. PROV259]